MRIMNAPPAPNHRSLICVGVVVGLALVGQACGGGGGQKSGSGGIGGLTGAAGSGPCVPIEPLERRLWRMSAEQWGSAVKDLLGLATVPVHGASVVMRDAIAGSTVSCDAL